MTSVMPSGQREGRFLHGFVGRPFSLPLFFNRFSIDTVALSLLSYVRRETIARCYDMPGQNHAVFSVHNFK